MASRGLCDVTLYFAWPVLHGFCFAPLLSKFFVFPVFPHFPNFSSVFSGYVGLSRVWLLSCFLVLDPDFCDYFELNISECPGLWEGHVILACGIAKVGLLLLTIGDCQSVAGSFVLVWKPLEAMC